MKRRPLPALSLCKRRKLPPCFSQERPPPSQERRDGAAVSIQRFLRWRRNLREHTDPILQGPLRPREAIYLTEPGGVAHWYNASSLAAYFLSTACFCSPLSRRQLWCWEVTKILAKQPPRTQPLLWATYIAREPLQKALHQQEGTDMAAAALEDSADERLQGMLRDAEGAFLVFDLGRTIDDLDDYEDDVTELMFLATDKARCLCHRHKEIISKRGLFCPPELADGVQAAHDRVLRRASDLEADGQGPDRQRKNRDQACSSVLQQALVRRLEFK